MHAPAWGRPAQLQFRELPVPAMVMRPLSLTVTTWFRDRDWVSLESGLVTRGRMPLQAASTSPLLTVQSHTEAGPAPALGCPAPTGLLGTVKGCPTPCSALSNPQSWGEPPEPGDNLGYGIPGSLMLEKPSQAMSPPCTNAHLVPRPEH